MARLSSRRRRTSRRRASRKPASGSRFAALVHKLEVRGDVADPRALAASIGRRKYGSRGFAKLAAAGRRSSRNLRRNPHSTDKTVVEYAMQSVLKGRSVATAAKATAKKLSGGTNYFIGGGGAVVSIDPKKLEEALWERIVDQCLKWLPDMVGREDDVFSTAAIRYEQVSSPESGWKPNEKFVKELRKRIIMRLGHDLFWVQPNRRHR